MIRPENPVLRRPGRPAAERTGVTFVVGTEVPDAEAAAQVSAALETNRIVCFRRSPVALPDEATLEYLRQQLPGHLSLKNISYHTAGERLSGLEADAPTRRRVAEVLREHLQEVTAFLQKTMPYLCVGWRVGKCSFRPVEERGRHLSAHASNELVHVDAGAYGATNGDRVLRFFVNVNEREDRVWATKGPIDQVLERHGVAAGILDSTGRLRRRLNRNLADRAFSLGVRGLGRFSHQAYVLDSSPYDRTMRRLHNYMKDSPVFKSDCDGYEELRFPPGAAWMVFTDGVSHACLAGQFAFVTTILIRRAALLHPECAPYGLLAAHASNRSMTSSG